MVFGIVGCSQQEEKLVIICQSNTFHDSSLTFDFKNNVVSVKQTLNQYGHEQKKLIERLSKIESFKKDLGEDNTKDMLDVFNEKEMTRHIRSVDDGFIVFGLRKERDEFMDFEWTLNRATLKMKEVNSIKESLIPEGSEVEPVTVKYEECKQPVI
jgi:hypothetical protein